MSFCDCLSTRRTRVRHDRLSERSHNPTARGRNQVSGGISRLVCTP
ncbi:hypothetical protein [Nostoc commune]|nr:hypothetical protein [Nostoc commune]